MRTSQFLVSAGVLTALTVQASALNLTFTGMAGGVSGVVRLDGTNRNVGIGKLKFTKSTGGTLLAVCGNLEESLNSSAHPYTQTNSNPLVTSPGLDLAARIVAMHFNSATTNNQQAALQLAVWEAIYDGGAVFTSNAGRFRLNDSGLNPLVTTAALYYSAVATPGTALKFETSANGGQDQLAPVPEPASMAALGLGVAALIRRRRAQRSA